MGIADRRYRDEHPSACTCYACNEGKRKKYYIDETKNIITQSKNKRNIPVQKETPKNIENANIFSYKLCSKCKVYSVIWNNVYKKMMCNKCGKELVKKRFLFWTYNTMK